MTIARSILHILAILLILASLGCSSKPVAQMELAQKAMDEAKEQQAEQLVPADWKRGQEAWDKGQSLLAKERYSEAKTQLLTARSRFEKARDYAKSKRADLLKEVEGIRKSIDTAYENLKADLKSPKLPGALRKTLGDRCKEIDESMAKLAAEIEKGAYVDARSSAQAIVQKIFEAEKQVPAYALAKR